MDDKTQKRCSQCGTGSYYVPWYPLDLGVAISDLQLLKNDGPLEGPSWQILLLLGLEFQTPWTKKWTNLATQCGEILLVHAQKQSELINTQLVHQQHLFPNSLTQPFGSMPWPLLLPQEPNFSFFSNLSLGAIKKKKNLSCKSPNTFKSRETR